MLRTVAWKATGSVSTTAGVEVLCVTAKSEWWSTGVVTESLLSAVFTSGLCVVTVTARWAVAPAKSTGSRPSKSIRHVPPVARTSSTQTTLPPSGVLPSSPVVPSNEQLPSAVVAAGTSWPAGIGWWTTRPSARV